MNPTVDEFLESVKNHEMTINWNNGINRHLKFRRPDTYMGWIDLLTWPGVLCINSDYGTYVFSRVEDMFEFFRMSEGDMMRRPDKKLLINPGYWSEKVLAQDQHCGIEKWSEEMFRENIRDWFDQYYDESTAEEKDEIWDQVKIEVFSECDNPYSAIRNAMEFSCEGHFPFQDAWEMRCMEYDYNFIFCLYAIVWGIQKYDEEMMEVQS